VPQVQGGEIVARGVGDERGVAEALDGVEQAELGAGMGAFAAHDQAGARRPGIQVHEIGDLDHLSAVPGLPVGLAGLRTTRELPRSGGLWHAGAG